MKQKLDYIPNDLVSLYDYERYAKERMSLNSLVMFVVELVMTYL
ncbi:hypothetical protein [Aliarcobacter butzleri]